MYLTDDQWNRVKEHFPEECAEPGRAGRKPVPARKVLEAVLWILNAGAPWKMLPQSFPNYKTVHRRFQRWCRQEILRNVLCSLANELRVTGKIDPHETYIDATFSRAKGGGLGVGRTKSGKGVKIMAIVERHGLPLALSTHAANIHEVKLVQLTLGLYMIEGHPENLIGDKAYDSDELDLELQKQNIEMIAPHRINRRAGTKTQDGRRLRRYQRRWIVERFFAWIQYKRRTLVRWEFHPANYLGFVQLAAMSLLLRQF